jgi:lipoic acid synthetase
MITLAQKTKTCSLQIRDFGLIDYRKLLKRQLDLHQKRTTGQITDTVFIAEHYPVITLGARKADNKLCSDIDSLKKSGIEVIETRRGGGITAHNPGQLVFYPILNLRQLNLGVSEYVRTLERIGIDLLKQFGIEVKRRKGCPGLWVKDRKIASVGVRVSRFVTYHGMAINISNDLSIFDYIVPCGIEGVKMTSVLKETGVYYSMDGVKEKLQVLLRKHLSISNEIRDTRYEIRKLPSWLKRPMPSGTDFDNTEKILESCGMETICVNANCPNRAGCWSQGSVAVLILGNICTRNCRFCSVAKGKPKPPDITEPARLAKMAEKLDLKYMVITSVTRDDLPDGGAGHFRDCIKAVRQRCPDMEFEILTPDFKNCQQKAIEILYDALPFVFAHNVETVQSLYPAARSGADYERSLNLLRLAKQTFPKIKTKSSIMLGLGETAAEVEQVLKDLRSVGCDMITIGQYLEPSKNSLDVVRYVPPDEFTYWEKKAYQLGFIHCVSEPFARSSYKSGLDDTRARTQDARLNKYRG